MRAQKEKSTQTDVINSAYCDPTFQIPISRNYLTNSFECVSQAGSQTGSDCNSFKYCTFCVAKRFFSSKRTSMLALLIFPHYIFSKWRKKILHLAEDHNRNYLSNLCYVEWSLNADDMFKIKHHCVILNNCEWITTRGSLGW